MKSYIAILAAALFISGFALSCFAACPSADLTDDCFVDFEDIDALAADWLNDCNASNDWCDGADITQNEIVNLSDFAEFAGQWLIEGSYTLNVNSSDALGVSISSGTGHNGITNYTQAITPGTSVSLTAPAAISDATFTGWTGNVNSGNQTISFSMDGNKTVTANYMVGMTWLSISDPGFSGQISKYETTNAQFCQFLNAALVTGDITVSGSTVYGANGTNGGADFAGQIYYDLAGAGYTYNGATDGGAARINYTGSSFTVDGGFDNHPVTHISWYGATAFCNYYGCKLPTEAEWQAAADYTGSFSYGCGTTINNSIANYLDSSHPNGTTAVGAFGTYGYGMADMAGNVREWTSTVNGSDRVSRGGSWDSSYSSCSVSNRAFLYPDGTCNFIGFRCRNIEPSGMLWGSINDSGFSGQMNKYETTNAQYCEFLNAALVTGDITVNGNTVYGANGTNGGVDFAGQVYYDLAGVGPTYGGVTNGGAARINYTGSSFTVDGGFTNHPVTYVSWYGSTAFCNYYGYRLPTESEWQAVADYDGSYSYGCGTTIDTSKANYYNSYHPNGTTAVNGFGTYGYGMYNMAGNVFEWTSSTYYGSFRVLRGGGWYAADYCCSVVYRSSGNQNYVCCDFGFRVCR
ncbi:MAG: SUMF1/EgtB/PvdO family nonheme iron enzyme [archaeon]